MKKIINSNDTIAIIGGGNIGKALAIGLEASGEFAPEQIIITRRNIDHLSDLANKGFIVQTNNKDAVKKSKIVVLAVRPGQIHNVINEIKSEIDIKNHILISIVSGVSIDELEKLIDKKIPIIRAMPNTAISIRESMTCLAAKSNNSTAVDIAKLIFDQVGYTVIINEEDMIPATALCACGIAFFLRAIRAASQGGIQIGFHAEEALTMAAQTAKGAACLMLNSRNNHPEMEIDKVTTPNGCTIAGLNQMEHEGFSSAMIKGIITSAEKAAKLYSGE